jgi:hypothetical protein
MRCPRPGDLAGESELVMSEYLDRSRKRDWASMTYVLKSEWPAAFSASSEMESARVGALSQCLGRDVASMI